MSLFSDSDQSAIIMSLVRLSNHEADRLTALQDRVLELEKLVHELKAV